MLEEIKEEIEICIQSKKYDELPDLIAAYKIYIPGMKEPYKTTHKTYIQNVEKQYQRLKIDALLDKPTSTNTIGLSKSTVNTPGSTAVNILGTQSTVDKLKESSQILAETEQVANDILNNLHSQRQKIDRCKDTVNEVRSELPKANKHVNNMNKWYRW